MASNPDENPAVSYTVLPSEREHLESKAQIAPASRRRLQEILPGLLLVFCLGLAAYLLSGLHSSLEALFLALILGMAARTLINAAAGLALGARLLPGVEWGVKVFIPVGIIFYGANLDFSKLFTLPFTTILLTLLCMGLFFILIYWLNSVWKLPWKISELIACGSAICGASAIAVLSPSADAEPEDTSVSLLVITAAGLIGVMIYPLIKELFGLSDATYAVLSGSTLHQTGLVRIAISSLDSETANLGMAVKTLRIIMLAPIALVTGVLRSQRREIAPEAAESAVANESKLAALGRVWFLLPFILVGLFISFVPLRQDFLLYLKSMATFLFSIALASIGFRVEIESVTSVGIKPLLIGLLGWIGVLVFFLLLSPLLL
ncbi:MAG: putative sulfate exporter family transporter [Anaerolineales bacterium]|nr:putative sulfate exporter family transporter [Anaerolineales bacterium]